MIKNIIISRPLIKNDHNLYSNLFHTTACLHVEANKWSALQENDKIQSNSPSTSVSGGEEIRLSEDSILNMKKEINEFKEEISKIRENEITQEVDIVKDYLSNNNNNSSSFDEAFPNYIRESGLNKEIIDENVKDDSISVMLNELNKILKKCKEAGLDQKCLEQINISGITEKVLSNNNNTGDIKNKVESLVIEQLNNIGNITIKELYEKTLKLKDKIDWQSSVNYFEVGSNLVSYGLLLKAFNKYVYNKPLPPGLSAQDMVVLRQVRSIGRVWFAGLFAPMLLFGFHTLRTKSSLFDIKININNKENSFMFLIFFKNLIGKRVKLFTRSAALALLIILIVIFFILYSNGRLSATNLISYIYLPADLIYPYIKVLLFISIIIPIVINAIFLWLFILIERKGTISIPILEKNNRKSASLLAFLISKLKVREVLDYLTKICSNKELLSYYRSRNIAEIKFYVIMLLMVLILFS